MHDVALERLTARHKLRLRHRDAGELHDVFCALLMHGERRSQHAGMRVRNAENLKDSLHAAILAELAVQRVEARIRLQRMKLAGDAVADIDLGDAVAFLTQRFADGRARIQAHLAFGRQSALQYGDVAASAFRHGAELRHVSFLLLRSSGLVGTSIGAFGSECFPYRSARCWHTETDDFPIEPDA